MCIVSVYVSQVIRKTLLAEARQKELDSRFTDMYRGAGLSPFVEDELWTVGQRAPQ